MNERSRTEKLRPALNLPTNRDYYMPMKIFLAIFSSRGVRTIAARLQARTFFRSVYETGEPMVINGFSQNVK